MEDGSSICCSCVVEYLDDGGQTLRRQAMKTAELALGRNELGDVALRVSHGQGAALGPLTVRQHAIHRRFMSQGKASIRLGTQKMQLLLSNCPPAQLRQFLQSLSLKVAARGKLQGARSQLLPDSALGFDEISPLCERDLEKAAQNGSKASLTTPKREETSSRAPKRKLADITNTTPARSNTEGDSFADQPSKKPRTTAILRGVHSHLSAEQTKVLEIVKSGESVFFTGSAGTGKSYLLKQILSILPPETTFATASTGSAASQIGGTTLHAFAGIGSGEASLEQCVSLASRPQKAAQWRKCGCLVIDEISMVDGDYFDKLDVVAKTVRRCNRPFGGIQLVLCGDFLQLPPVAREGEKTYCFQAKCWKWCVSRSIELTEIYRQKDKQFIALLQNIRIGRCPPAVSKLLQGTKHQQIESGGIKATRLYTHTADVAATNRKQLAALEGELHKFPAHDSESTLTSQQLDTLCPVSATLHLKIGAQVMLAKNTDVCRGLVNGARGVVIKFNTAQRGLPVVRFASGLEMTITPERFLVRAGGGLITVRRQLPLRLAWAISIHKSQGMTLDCVEISLGRAFEDGQAYVALSRARSLKCVRVTDFQPSCVRAHPAVLEFYRFLRRMRQNYISPLSP